MIPSPDYGSLPPSSLGELFDFYESYVKPLYLDVSQSEGLPVNLSVSITNAFDYLSPHWTRGIAEKDIVARAYGELLESCFTLCSLKVKSARKIYQQLQKIDTSGIDNGNFDRNLHQLFRDINIKAKEARHLQNYYSDDEDKSPLLHRWQEVYLSCIRLEQGFLYHPRIGWARQRGWVIFLRNNLVGLILGIFASVIANDLNSLVDLKQVLVALIIIWIGVMLYSFIRKY